jgi:hypothetical protein
MLDLLLRDPPGMVVHSVGCQLRRLNAVQAVRDWLAGPAACFLSRRGVPLAVP